MLLHLCPAALRRLGLALLLLPLASVADANPAQAAQPFPQRPVHIVVPVAAGGSADRLTRVLAERLGRLWGQAVVVDNVPGASGNLGAARVAHAAPDGYTLLQQGEGLTLNALLYEQLPYDSQSAFVPVIKAVVNPQILVVNPATGLHSFQDYLARARAQPGSISLGLPGNGGIAHVAHALITQQTGARVNYIPYGGGGPATVDVLAGHVDATLITLAAVTEQVRSGRLRALAVTTAYRSPALPEVPTMAEAGLPGFSVESWQGYFVPASTPPERVRQLNQDIDTALHSPEVKARLEDLGFKVQGGSTDELARSLQSERPRYAQAIRSAGISLR
ncbi:MAG: tripartite tricarboxylate transporter substrate binding protein [Curvibacter sp.]|nr:tripartite tricarboxylate transporter substrate binding protein [Curvibacter sp.]